MFEELQRILSQIQKPVIAVSGGVDSVTLAAFATRCLGSVKVMHAVSPAVTFEATVRVQQLAQEHHWHLTIVEAGEFDDPNYRANPVNRCFYCKTNLYATVRAHTDGQILSGANRDDLGEYRPGLDAARDHGVRHPYVEAGLDKASVRRLARKLELGDIAELPSSPCLSSRVETGIRIEARTLGFIHRAERLVSTTRSLGTVRCRVRAKAIVIELDADSLAGLSAAAAQGLADSIDALAGRPPQLPILFQAYRNGSAFLREVE